MIQNLDVALNFQQRGSRWYRFANINGSVPAVLHPLILSSVVFLTPNFTSRVKINESVYLH